MISRRFPYLRLGKFLTSATDIGGPEWFIISLRYPRRSKLHFTAGPISHVLKGKTLECRCFSSLRGSKTEGRLSMASHYRSGAYPGPTSAVPDHLGKKPNIPSNSPNVKLTISACIFHLRNYYASSARIDPVELCSTIEKIEECAKESLKSDDLEFLLSCCSISATPALRPTHLTELAERIWSVIPKFGLQQSSYLFLTLLRVYCINWSAVPTALHLLERVDKLGIRKGRRTLGMILRLACQQGDMDTARTVFQSLRDEDPRLLPIVYHHLIYGYLRRKDEEGYSQIISIMESEGVQFDSSAYTAIMEAFADRGDMSHLFKVLEEADSNSIVFSDGQLLRCVYAIARSTEAPGEHIDKILSRLSEWKLSKLVRLMQQLVSIDRVDAAWRVFVSSSLYTPSSSASEHSEQIDVGSFLIEQLFRIKSPPEAIWDLCKRLQESGVHRRPYLTALQCCFERGLEKMAVEIFAHLRTNNYQVRPQYLVPLVILMAKRGATIQEMLDAVWLWFDSLRPDDKTDRLLNDAFFGRWFWPCTARSRQVQSGSGTSTEYVPVTEDLMEDLETSMDSLVRGSVQVATSGNLLTGFIHYCLIKYNARAIREALRRYPNVHIAGYKLHVALSRYYLRTRSAETVVLVLKAAAADPGYDRVGFTPGNGVLLKNLLAVASIEYYIELVEKMAEANLTVDSILVREVMRHWNNAPGKFKGRLYKSLKTMTTPA